MWIRVFPDAYDLRRDQDTINPRTRSDINKLVEKAVGGGDPTRISTISAGVGCVAYRVITTCISFLGSVAFKLSRVARPSPLSFHNHHLAFQSLHLPPRHLRLESYALTRSYTVVRRIK